MLYDGIRNIRVMQTSILLSHHSHCFEFFLFLLKISSQRHTLRDDILQNQKKKNEKIHNFETTFNFVKILIIRYFKTNFTQKKLTSDRKKKNIFIENELL